MEFVQARAQCPVPPHRRTHQNIGDRTSLDNARATSCDVADSQRPSTRRSTLLAGHVAVTPIGPTTFESSASSAALAALFSPFIWNTLPPFTDGRILRESSPNFARSTRSLAAAKTSAKDLISSFLFNTPAAVRGVFIFRAEAAARADFGFFPWDLVCSCTSFREGAGADSSIFFLSPAATRFARFPSFRGRTATKPCRRRRSMAFPSSPLPPTQTSAYTTSRVAAP